MCLNLIHSARLKQQALMSRGDRLITRDETREDSEPTFTYFGCTINILDRKDNPQAVEQDLGQRGDELRGGHQDIHTV